jgi:hypothetical protein
MVRDRVERDILDRVNAAQDQHDRPQQNDELVLERKIDDALEHRSEWKAGELE